MNKQNKNQYFAEIVDSSLSQCIAQSWSWDFFPDYGSVVVIETEDIKYFSIVSEITTGSLDPVRVPIAYKKTEAELLRDQPQIFEFLKTSFTCLVLGYIDNKDLNISYLTPSKPPKIHSFIRNISPKELNDFINNYDFLYLIFNNSGNISSIDELLLAFFKNISEKNISKKINVSEFANLFINLIGKDYQRLRLFLARLELIINSNNNLHKESVLEINN